MIGLITIFMRLAGFISAVVTFVVISLRLCIPPSNDLRNQQSFYAFSLSSSWYNYRGRQEFLKLSYFCFWKSKDFGDIPSFYHLNNSEFDGELEGLGQGIIGIKSAVEVELVRGIISIFLSACWNLLQ